MCVLSIGVLALVSVSDQTLGPGDHMRQVGIGDSTRSYLVHVPPKHDSGTPVPVVLIFHGAGITARRMTSFCGLSEKADAAGFVAVYPNATPLNGGLQTWNAGGLRGRLAATRPDDVAFVTTVLDDLGQVVHVDPERVYATGMSNGAAMCYRLAAELSDRIAAIAAVSGPMSIESCAPRRPVPVLHFHGKADKIVRYDGPSDRTSEFVTFKSIEETIRIWVEVNRCPETPTTTKLPDKVDDGTSVTRRAYGPGADGAEVVLFVIEGGGHAWPGRDPTYRFLGKSTKDISANDLIWEFFQKHPMK
ncbi:MAG: PHB depolymerase family esterase [Planctomycetota bacterium]